MDVSNKEGIKIRSGILLRNAINSKNKPVQKKRIEKHFKTIKLTPNTFIIKPSKVGYNGALAK